ncbi:hypothetical protein OIU78_023912 [Salix suchowensis]|nr:hypothetical protein OIU78_023912 [Salix suchowensis]
MERPEAQSQTLRTTEKASVVKTFLDGGENGINIILLICLHFLSCVLSTAGRKKGLCFPTSCSIKGRVVHLVTQYLQVFLILFFFCLTSF